MKNPKMGVDTPYAGSFAQIEQDRRQSTGLIDPKTLPVQFQEEQRRRNIQIRMGTMGCSPEIVKSATTEEFKQFPK